MNNEFELIAKFDSRKSFYGKAKVITNNNIVQLRSYNTVVTEIKNEKVKIFGTYSPTTLRHIKEFLKQNNFKADTKKQIENDYM